MEVGILTVVDEPTPKPDASAAKLWEQQRDIPARTGEDGQPSTPIGRPFMERPATVFSIDSKPMSPLPKHCLVLSIFFMQHYVASQVEGNTL